mmetsp:Transcript_6447/g.6705  ORF Transcript_6447/g.6705 Transcript_6447/m.6705 type:complete len:185 (-) Transcript_6447:27-581(-)
MRSVWDAYYAKVDGIIYVIDSADTDNIVESRKEFQKLLGNEELKNSVILIFANKQDKEEAMKLSEVIKHYNLDSIKDHIWHIQGCSGKTGEGLLEGLHWLSDQIVNIKENKFKNNPYLKDSNSSNSNKYSNPNESIQTQKLDNTSSNMSYITSRSSQHGNILSEENKKKNNSKVDDSSDLKVEI